MTKITLDLWRWGPFHNKSGVIVSWENVRTNKDVQMYKILQQKNLFLCQKKTPSKRKRPKLFFAKFDLYNMDFQSLFSQISKIWELFFWSVGNYFSCKRLHLQRKTALFLRRNWLFLTMGASLVGQPGFYLTNRIKTINFKWHFWLVKTIPSSLFV